MMTTINEGVIWLNGLESFGEERKRIGRCPEDYKRLYLHSELGYLSPQDFETRYEGESIRKVA
jgi:hypothetical protein